MRTAVSKIRVPDSLTELDQWVLWRFEARQGKRTKVPYQVNGRNADSTDPKTWTSYEEALCAWCRNPKWYAGIGFVFSREDALAGIDLDDSIDEQGSVKPWAQGIVERFGDTYTEVSPSCRGLKIWARGSLPANLPGVQVGDGAVELYDHARYFTVTGCAFRGAPLEIEEHSADLLMLYQRLAGGRKGWPLQPLPGGQIPFGRQHNTLVSLCGTLRTRGVCEEAIEACLQIVNERQCEKPGPREHIIRIVRSSRKWGAR
jgi:primase-polymerase (primpol)-like protein